MGDMNVSSGGSCSFVGEYGNWGIMASKQQECAAAAAHVAGFKGFVAPTPASATATVTRAEAEAAATVCVSVVESSLSSGLRFNHYHRPREHRAAVAAESARITTALGFPECASASASASASVCCSNNNNNSSSSNNNNSPNSSYEVSVDALKTRIAAHPRYPRLLSAYMHCQKIGAPSEVASLLQDFTEQHGRHVAAVELGIDPELDQFMDAFSQLLEELHNQMRNPYGEAMEFLHRMEGQLRSLNLEGINSGVTSGQWEEREVDDGSGQQSSEEEFSREESDHQHQQQPEVTDVDHDHSAAHDRELKEQLLRKYIGYFSTLKQEFLKKKKKGKLPKEAREQLLDWWEAHYSWPYPSELDKAALAESTGLDQKQINNWFINQRKRHWKPSEDMQYFW